MTAVDRRGLLIGFRNIGKIRPEKGGRIGDLRCDKEKNQYDSIGGRVLQQPRPRHNGIDRNDDHDDRNPHRRGEGGANPAPSRERKALQSIGVGGADQDEERAGHAGVEKRIPEENGDIRADPRLDIVFEVEARREFQHLSGEDLRRGGQARREDPKKQRRGKENPGDEHKIAR